ncbi:MAG: alpha/beta hydrolase [Ardenticatenales bacterium]|nr:alpha/beta hydrolase [Ardenticatenales bacterium]
MTEPLPTTWLNIAHANGYPPRCYRALTEALAPGFHAVGLPTRPMSAAESDGWVGLATWRPLADDLVAAIEALACANGTGPVVGLGHSLGGVLTLYAAVARPDLFSHVVLVDPVFIEPTALAATAAEGDNGDSPRAALVRGAVGRRYRWADADEAFAHFRPKPVFERFDDAALVDYVAGALTDDVADDAAGGLTLAIPREWEAQIHRTSPTDVWDVLPRLTVPTLAIRGALSDTLSPAAWQRWQALQPAATFVEIPGVGHLLPFEAPGAVADAVRSFVDEIRLR